jgi:hypothetical protein
MNLEFIMVPVILWICVTGFYKVLELYARRRERMVIIEKFGDKFEPALLHNMSPGFPNLNFGKSFGALKAGCLLLGLGLGLLVGLFIYLALTANGYEENWHNRQIFSVAYSASVLIFGSIGLIVAFVIELKMQNREKQK